MRRNLDGVYFRIGTDNICFSDLTEEQMYEMMEDRSEKWLKSLCIILAQSLKKIGDQFDIIQDHGEEE